MENSARGLPIEGPGETGADFARNGCDHLCRNASGFVRGRILCDAGWTTSLKRTSERGIESTRSDVSPSHRRRSNFFGGFVAFCSLFVLGFWLVVCFCVSLFVPHGLEVTPVVCKVVCEVERPSELSWRARHGRKKSHGARSCYPLWLKNSPEAIRGRGPQTCVFLGKDGV